jgi:hypothetical protein
VVEFSHILNLLEKKKDEKISQPRALKLGRKVGHSSHSSPLREATSRDGIFAPPAAQSTFLSG